MGHFGHPNDHEHTWNPSIKMRDVVEKVFEIINNPEPGCLWPECNKLFKEDREKFNERANMWTRKYAT